MEFKAEVNYSTGLISATGSEDFVMRVLDWAKEQRDSFKASSIKLEDSTPTVGSFSTPTAAEEKNSDPLSAYSDVFDMRGDDVAVIADTKQNTTSATARFTAMLYLYGRKLIGKPETTDDEIRQLCEEHACYDSKNFASHMAGLKGKVIQDGSSRKFTVKLTVPGEREAKAMAEKIQNASSEA